jgi:hypothetical protein
LVMSNAADYFDVPRDTIAQRTQKNSSGNASISIERNAIDSLIPQY